MMIHPLIRLGGLILGLLGLIKLSSRVGALASLSPKLSHHGFRLNSCGLGAQRGHPQRRAHPHGQARPAPLTLVVLCALLVIYWARDEAAQKPRRPFFAFSCHLGPHCEIPPTTARLGRLLCVCLCPSTCLHQSGGSARAVRRHSGLAWCMVGPQGGRLSEQNPRSDAPF